MGGGSRQGENYRVREREAGAMNGAGEGFGIVKTLIVGQHRDSM